MSSTSTKILMGVALCLATAASHAERYVVVNGERMNDAQIQTLERIRCGPIPNGHYWLNVNTGVWGYAGNPTPQGNITDNCYQPQRRPSLSERGMLFSPGDWVR